MSENRTPDTEEKLEAVPLTESSKILRKLDNFWYHHKWTTIGVTFFLVVAVICVIQIFSRPKYDTSIVVVTSYRMDNEEHANFEALMKSLIPEDFDGNGKKTINIVTYQYYSPGEIADRNEAVEAESDVFVVNPQYNNSELNSFTNYTMTGETSVCIVSPDVYTRLIEKERLFSLSEIYEGEMPNGTRADGYGIDIKDTDLYRYNSAMSVLPEDSILCLLRPTVRGYSSDKENYAKEQRFFHALADFDVVDED